jgi:hypothetical protein
MLKGKIVPMSRSSPRFLPFCFLIGVLSLNACVNIGVVENWRPETPSIDNDFKKCWAQAQEKLVPNPLGPGASAYPQCRVLALCLESHGYYVRDESLFELASDFILFPVYGLANGFGACFKRWTGPMAWPYDRKP